MKPINRATLLIATATAFTIGVATTATAAPTPILAPPCVPHYGCQTYNTKGFNQARPATVYLGGDGTSGICRIHWLTWGGRFAIGEGTAADVTIHQTDAEGEWNPAIIVASHLGTWRGRPAYRQVQWTFPNGEQHPESRGCTAF